jgi:hypothetical protein
MSYQSTSGEQKVLKTSEIFVEVKSPVSPSGTPAAGPPAELRDIKPLIPAGYDRRLIAAIAGGIAALILGVVGGVWWWRRRQREEGAPLPAPHEVALNELTALRDLARGRGEHKAFHFALSATLRSYCEAACGFPATDRTIEEISRDISAIGSWDEATRKSFLHILKQSERVKFADYVPSEEESVASLEEATALVMKTRPQLPEDSAAASQQLAENVI